MRMRKETDEMARKRKRRVRLNPAFVLTVMLLVISAVVLFLTPIFQIEKITITGNDRITKTEIMIASKIREGRNIFMINKSTAEKNIKTVGYIENVRIKRRLPGEVIIAVKEDLPEFYLDIGETFAGVNSKGQTLCHTRKAGLPEGCLVVKGLGVKEAAVGSKIVLNEGRDDEYEILRRLMDSFEQYGIKNEITNVDVTKKDTISFKYRRALKVEFGGTNDYNLKFNYFMAMLNELRDKPEGVINLQTDNYTYSYVIEPDEETVEIATQILEKN